MKKSFFSIGILIFAVLVYASNKPDTKVAASNEEIELLKAKVDSLQQQVKEMDIKIEKLSGMIYTIKIPQSFPNLNELPDGWEKRKFNKYQYYIIPCEKK